MKSALLLTLAMFLIGCGSSEEPSQWTCEQRGQVNAPGYVGKTVSEAKETARVGEKQLVAVPQARWSATGSKRLDTVYVWKLNGKIMTACQSTMAGS